MRRLPVLVLIVAVLVGVGLLAGSLHAPVPVPPPSLAVVSQAAPGASESSSWYCTGDSGTTGNAAVATLYLVNATGRTVSGTVTVSNDTGGVAGAPVRIRAHGESTFSPQTVLSGHWLASRVDLDGGGVTVTEEVVGPLGWSVAPCASVAAPDWYFASGSTQTGNLLFLSLYNPGTTTAVVDTTFVTPSGPTAPQLFQGLVVAPGALVVAGVASYVQNASTVSTIVQARSGQIVAAELQEYSVGAISGLSLRLGTAQPASRWTLPRTVDVVGGRTTVVVFNPTPSAQAVTVVVHLATGSATSFHEVVAADTAWNLSSSSAKRLPLNYDYGTTVTSTGGGGVVVDRIGEAPAAGALPQWGAVGAVSTGIASAPSRHWVVANPAVAANPPEKTAVPFALDLENPGTTTVTAEVTWTSGRQARTHRLARYRFRPGAFVVIEPTVLAKVGDHPLTVTSSGPMAVLEDATPAGMPGIVAVPAIPLAGPRSG